MSTATGLTAGSETLLTQARGLLAEALPPHLSRFHERLPSDESVQRPTAMHRLPVLEWLSRLPQPVPETMQNLVSDFIEKAPRLQWGQTYSADDVSTKFSTDFLARYGWHEVVGTRGPVPSDDVALGFLLLEPQVDYPRHVHNADEVYVALAGTACWQRDRGAFTARPPGAVIHHPPRMPHAMRTTTEPMLALYVWHGADLAEKSRFTD